MKIFISALAAAILTASTICPATITAVDVEDTTTTTDTTDTNLLGELIDLRTQNAKLKSEKENLVLANNELIYKVKQLQSELDNLQNLDANADGILDATDATIILNIYSINSTGGNIQSLADYRQYLETGTYPTTIIMPPAVTTVYTDNN